jgi:hypothetical protein
MGTWKGIISPHLRKQRRLDSQEYAEYVFQQEQKREKPWPQ